MVIQYIECPCKNCESRHLACHSECDAYAEFKSMREEANRKYREESCDKYAYIVRILKHKRK